MALLLLTIPLALASAPRSESFTYAAGTNSGSCANPNDDPSSIFRQTEPITSLEGSACFRFAPGETFASLTAVNALGNPVTARYFYEFAPGTPGIFLQKPVVFCGQADAPALLNATAPYNLVVDVGHVPPIPQACEVTTDIPIAGTITAEYH